MPQQSPHLVQTYSAAQPARRGEVARCMRVHPAMHRQPGFHAEPVKDLFYVTRLQRLLGSVGFLGKERKGSPLLHAEAANFPPLGGPRLTGNDNLSHFAVVEFATAHLAFAVLPIAPKGDTDFRKGKSLRRGIAIGPALG